MKNSTLLFIVNEIFKVEADKIQADVVMNASYKNGESYDLVVYLENNEDNVVLKKDVTVTISDENIYQEALKRHIVPLDIFKESLKVEFPRNKGFICKEVTTNNFEYSGVDHRGNDFHESKHINIFEKESVML